MLNLGVERTPDPNTSGNRCATPDPRYPTPLSAKVLISRMTVYSILTVQSSWHQSSENSCPINWLATTRLLPNIRLKILMNLSSPHRVNLTLTQSWSQLTYPIRSPWQIFSVRSIPTYHFLLFLIKCDILSNKLMTTKHYISNHILICNFPCYIVKAASVQL